MYHHPHHEELDNLQSSSQIFSPSSSSSISTAELYWPHTPLHFKVISFMEPFSPDWILLSRASGQSNIVQYWQNPISTSGPPEKKYTFLSRIKRQKFPPPSVFTTGVEFIKVIDGSINLSYKREKESLYTDKSRLKKCQDICFDEGCK